MIQTRWERLATGIVGGVMGVVIFTGCSTRLTERQFSPTKSELTAQSESCSADTTPLDDVPMLPTATYEVTFVSDWTATSHPTNFPASAHFSGLIGVTHRADYRVWQEGCLTSAGIELMAERGGKRDLTTEFNSKITQGVAETIISGGGISSSPGSVTVTFSISSRFPRV